MTRSLTTCALTATAALTATTAAAAVLGNYRLRQRLSHARQQLDTAVRSARRDPLTGLSNRRGIDGHLAVSAGSTDPIWVMLLDLDGFKPVNDTYGHASGDVVLATVARRLQRIDNALAGRLGGDEFVLIVEAETSDDAARIATDVISSVRRPITVRSNVRIRVTASMGWLPLQPGDDPGDVLHTADTALYRAKAAGGNRAVAWNTDEPLRTVKDVRPIDRLRDAHPHRALSEFGVVGVR
jgi:diguanylate cyclase (GGDEF)-like protein